MYDENTKQLIDNGGTVFFAQELKFAQNAYTLQTGDSAQLSVAIKPEESSERTIVWESSDPVILSIDACGNMTAHAVGTVRVKAKCDYGTDRCTITVEKGKPMLQINRAYDLLLDQKRVHIKWQLPQNAGSAHITSADPSVVSVLSSQDGKADIQLNHIGKTSLQLRIEESRDYLPLHITIPVTVYEKELPAIRFENVSNTVNGVYLSWKPFERAAGYYIYRCGKDGFYSKIADIKKAGGEPAGTHSILDNTVTSGERYTYQIRAYTDYDISTEELQGTTIKYLSAVSQSDIINTDNSLILRWDSVIGAERYQIFRKNKGNDYQFIAEINATEAEKKSPLIHQNQGMYRDIDLKEGEIYDYLIRARAKSAYGASPKEPVSAVYLRAPVISKLQSGDGYTRLTWKPVDFAEGYQIYRKANDADWRLVSESKEHSYKDENVTNMNLYTYRVCAVRNGYAGPWQKEERGIWYLDPPKLLSVNARDDTVVVRWIPVRGAERYSISRKTDDAGWKRLGFVDGNANTEYVDNNIEPGVEYAYTIRAWRSNSMSQISSKSMVGIAEADQE